MYHKNLHIHFLGIGGIGMSGNGQVRGGCNILNVIISSRSIHR